MEPVKSIKKLSKDKKVSPKFLKKQEEMGENVEKEHTNSHGKAEKIAKQHLNERPDYYNMLKKAEKSKVVISGKEDYKRYKKK